jgi:hypothetical protein
MARLVQGTNFRLSYLVGKEFIGVTFNPLSDLG